MLSLRITNRIGSKMRIKRFVESVFAALIFLALNITAAACPLCRTQVRNGVYDENFFGNLFVLLLPVFIIAGLGFGLYHADKISNLLRRLK